jgi:dTDP-4-amino-4,6-dideoxygalactose transaminase
VIYDAAHAFGVQFDNVCIGNFGDITMFSFHATKMFHTAEGGALCFKDKKLKTRVDLLKNFGIKDEEHVILPGINGKMNEIQAALGLVVLNHVDEEIRKRKHLIETYRKCLKNVEGITYLEDNNKVVGNYQYFIIKINEKEFGLSRDFVYDKFKEYNVFTRKYFYPLCSEYDYYRHLPSSLPANLPVAHEVAKQVLFLPLYGELSLDDVVKICDILTGIRRL